MRSLGPYSTPTKHVSVLTIGSDAEPRALLNPNETRLRAHDRVGCGASGLTQPQRNTSPCSRSGRMRSLGPYSTPTKHVSVLTIGSDAEPRALLNLNQPNVNR